MNPVTHFEMPYVDAGRMMKFYSEVFGWELQMLGQTMGDYILATTAKTDARPGMPAGTINGGFYQRKPDWPDQYPSIVISVHDVIESMAKLKRAGGEVLGDPMPIPGVGLYVSFHDTEGNRVSMLQAQGQ